MDNLAQWIKNKRLKNQLDIRALSSESFVTTAQISRIENNQSSITINALVGLGYGLDFDLMDVMRELKISPYFPKLRNQKTKISSAKPIPKISDAYAIWRYFRDQPQRAKALMYEGYSQAQALKGVERVDEIQKSYDAVWESIQAHSDAFTPLPYPVDLKLDHYIEIYSAGGVITNIDLGMSLIDLRVSNGLSQRELAEKTEISHSVISRLEHGLIDRVLLDYIVTLDKVLHADGELIAFAWEAGEYQTGISLLRYLNDIKQQSQKLGYTKWDLASKAWADTLIAICRWHYVNSSDSTWWSKVKREIEFYKK